MDAGRRHRGRAGGRPRDRDRDRRGARRRRDPRAPLRAAGPGRCSAALALTPVLLRAVDLGLAAARGRARAHAAGAGRRDRRRRAGRRAAGAAVRAPPHRPAAGGAGGAAVPRSRSKRAATRPTCSSRSTSSVAAGALAWAVPRIRRGEGARSAARQRRDGVAARRRDGALHAPGGVLDVARQGAGADGLLLRAVRAAVRRVRATSTGRCGCCAPGSECWSRWRWRSPRSASSSTRRGGCCSTRR